MHAHESNPPIVVYTTELGVKQYAIVLQSREECTNDRVSPTSRTHKKWSIRQACAPDLDPRWACGAGGEYHVKDYAPNPGREH